MSSTVATDANSPVEMEEFQYDNKIVRNFAIATVLYGLIGVLVGVLIAFQLAYPFLNFELSYTTFGRLRPLYTNAVVFAFVGNGFFTGMYYSALCAPRAVRHAGYHSGGSHHASHGFYDL